MKKTRFKKIAMIMTYIMLVLFIQIAIVASVLYYDDSNLLYEIRGTIVKTSYEPARPACSRVVQVLEDNLRRIGDGGDAAAFLERAKILNILAIEACDDGDRHNYLSLAMAELSVGDALRMMNGPVTDVGQRMGFFWRERADFYRMHDMHAEELEIYENFLSVPGRGRDIFALVKKAEIFIRMNRHLDAARIFADVAEICRTANNSNCFAAAVGFADFLDENGDNSEIRQMLRQRWSRDSDFRHLFRHNRDAMTRIRASIK